MLINQSISNPNRPNFKAKIRFSQAAYNNLDFRVMAKEGRCIGFPWLMEDSKILKEGFSNKATVCTMGFFKFQGAQKGYLFHSIPTSNPFDKVKKIIIPVIKKFQESGKQLEGILTGANVENERSVDQAKSFMELFDEFDIKYSAFLVQRLRENPRNKPQLPCYGVDLFASAPKDEYIIASSDTPMFYKHEIELPKRFLIIKKAPQDTIVFE